MSIIECTCQDPVNGIGVHYHVVEDKDLCEHQESGS